MFGGTKYCDYTITPSNRSFFEFTDKEKTEVLSNAAQQSNEDQARLMAKSTDQKPIWEEEFNRRFIQDSCPISIKGVKQFIKEVEKAAYERGVVEGHQEGWITGRESGYEDGYDAGLDEVGMERVDKTKEINWKKMSKL